MQDKMINNTKYSTVKVLCSTLKLGVKYKACLGDSVYEIKCGVNRKGKVSVLHCMDNVKGGFRQSYSKDRFNNLMVYPEQETK